MDGAILQNRISRGMGVAARRLGTPNIVYRPSGPAQPLSSRNRIIRLQAAFNTGDSALKTVTGYGGSLWHGVFDSFYTKPGDYLASTASTFFVAAQRPLLPAQCVLTNRTVRIGRPAPACNGGYSGMVDEAADMVITGWPACVQILHATTSGTPPDSRFGVWRVLLPTLPATPQVADIVTDDQDNIFSVAAAEETDLGWRLIVRQIAG
jgi:hypothetical protein